MHEQSNERTYHDLFHDNKAVPHLVLRHRPYNRKLIQQQCQKLKRRNTIIILRHRNTARSVRPTRQHRQPSRHRQRRRTTQARTIRKHTQEHRNQRNQKSSTCRVARSYHSRRQSRQRTISQKLQFPRQRLRRPQQTKDTNTRKRTTQAQHPHRTTCQEPILPARQTPMTTLRYPSYRVPSNRDPVRQQGGKALAKYGQFSSTHPRYFAKYFARCFTSVRSPTSVPTLHV